MAQSRNQKKNDRMQSAASITAGGGVVADNPNDYPTQTLFEQIKDKQVYYI
jgi:hypothetical protein